LICLPLIIVTPVRYMYFRSYQDCSHICVIFLLLAYHRTYKDIRCSFHLWLCFIAHTDVAFFEQGGARNTIRHELNHRRRGR